jgi:hypothetical protein
MEKISTLVLGLSALGFLATAFAQSPALENDRVRVWDTTTALPPAEHDFVAVSLTHKGHAKFGHLGEVPAKDGAHTVVIELKGLALPPIPNATGLPLAFPRPHVKKLLENEQVLVWSYEWQPGVPTPMHFHDKDALVVFEAVGAMSSTTPDGKSVVNEFKYGDIRFNKRDRAHSELLVRGSSRAIITELK